MTHPDAPGAKKLVFFVTEDWFFASHFLPMARAAGEMGMDVTVITRVRLHREAIETTGVRVIPFSLERRSANPLEAGYAAGRLAAILNRLRPDIVHCIAIRGILIGGAAGWLARVPRRVYALTGLGLLGARAASPGRPLRPAVKVMMRTIIRGPLDGPMTHFLFENADDPHQFGLAPDDSERVTVVGGAGVDPTAFEPASLPPMPPLRVAVAARMLWSKGVDLVVAAVREARSRGAAVELSLYGAPDLSNPTSITEKVLREWGEEDGITWLGHVQDVAGIWRDHHVGCLASRGGEGLPRTILETAACGRAVLTTDVPGCRDLIRDGIEGLVVPPNDVPALAGALVRLAGDPALVARLGEAARARVLDGFTERHVMDKVKAMYGRLLAR